MKWQTGFFSLSRSAGSKGISRMQDEKYIIRGMQCMLIKVIGADKKEDTMLVNVIRYLCGKGCL